MFEDFNVGDILSRLIALKDAVNEPEEEFGLMEQFFREPPVVAGLVAAGFVPENLTVSEVDLTGGEDYEVLPEDGIIVVTETAGGGDGDILLPPATGSLRKLIVSVQHATNSVGISADSSDTINLSSSLTVQALTTVVLLDYAEGKWMTL